jgi:hypothetical protein
MLEARRRKGDILDRRGTQVTNIAKIAAACRMVTWVFYAMRDGQVRTLATSSPTAAWAGPPDEEPSPLGWNSPATGKTVRVATGAELYLGVRWTPVDGQASAGPRRPG